MRTVKDFRVLTIDLGIGGASHTLYIKEHISKSTSEDGNNQPAGRTMFVGNVDYGRILPNSDVEGFLTDMFSSFGDIESISLSQFRLEDEYIFSRKTRFAHIVFEKKKSLKLAISATDSIYYDISNAVSQKWGLGEAIRPKKVKRILEQTKLGDTDVESLKYEVDEVLAHFEEKEKQTAEERKRMFEEVDDDGFTVVKPRKKRKRVDATRRSSGAPRLRKKKEHELKNFYRFQMREEKREKLAELRKKFEEDKQKIAEMKAQRKFKPF